MKIPSVLLVTRKELLSLFSILWIVSIAFLYILITIFVLNYRLVATALVASFPFADKVAILLSLLEGLFTAFSPGDTIIMLLSAVLVGVNILLIGKTIYLLEHAGKLRLSIGGATLIGLISAGCSSCGFSLLSILGLSTSLSFLPFHGMGLHVLSAVFLLFSSWYMLKKLRDSLYCKR